MPHIPTVPDTCKGPNTHGPTGPATEPLAAFAQGPEDGALDLAAGRAMATQAGHDPLALAGPAGPAAEREDCWV